MEEKLEIEIIYTNKKDNSLLEIYTEIVELNISEEKIQNKIEENVPSYLYSRYYFDEDVSGNCVRRTIVKRKLYLLETGKIGYDSYSSGVFAAYNEIEALEIAIKKHSDFKNARIMEIGEVSNDGVNDIVCLDYHSG
jgi:hypothetical protein